MNSINKKLTVPKMRFPEFRDKGEWAIKTLDSLAKRVTDRNNGAKLKRVLTNSAVNGVVDQRDYFEKDIANQSNLDNYFIIHVGDYVYNPRISATAPVGPISKNKISKGVMSPIYTVFRFNDHNDFYEQYFKTTCWHKYMQGISNSGARYDRMSILNKDFMSMPLPYPSLPEQQKIADCLTSLDELVTTEAGKLEAYKTHKKGLMQKLFPAERKDVPEWRFPEFRGKGVWLGRQLGDICRFVRGPFGGALKKEIFVNEGYAVYEQSHAIYENFDSFRYFITEEKFTELNRFSVKPNDIIMSCSGTMGKFAIIPKKTKKGLINQALLKLTVNKGYIIKFLKMTLELQINQENLLSQSAGGAIKNVAGVSQLKEICLYMPSLEEQQKIADCLSSLDELITTQARKIDTLKAHKKALMQGLFPSDEGVEG